MLRTIWNTARRAVRLQGAVLIIALFGAVPMGAQDGRLNLRDADLSVFVELVSELTGRNFVVDPRVQGTVTIYAPAAIDPDEVFGIFLNVLELNRFTLVEGDGVDRIVPSQLARELSPFDGRTAKDGFVTRALRVRNVPLNEAAEIITPLMAPEAVISQYPIGGLLIVSDRAANIDRVAALIERLDAIRPSRIEVINLRNAASPTLAETLRALELASPGSSIVADQRSNTLVVSGSDEFRLMVRTLVSQLDRPRNVSDAVVVHLKYADAAEIADIGTKLFASQSSEGDAGGESAIVADETTNSVLISASPDTLQSIVRAVRNLDRRPNQVLVEGIIFEMSADSFATLGVQFGGVVNEVFAGGVQFDVGGVPSLGSLVTTLATGGTPSLGGGLNVGVTTKDQLALGFLSAVARDSTTNILSTPSLLTLDNEEAEITVAQNVPFVTGRFSTVGDDAIPNQPFQTIQRQDVGLILNVVPQITGDGTVRLRVRQEVSNLTNAAAASGSEITQRRAINTSIIVGDGNVVLLGGLMEDFSNEVKEKVPGLGDVPILRKLFSAKSADGSKRILLLLLRTHVISDDDAASAATNQAYDRALAEQRKLFLNDDDSYPNAPTGGLPASLPKLGRPFTPGGASAPKSGALLPSLGKPLNLKKR
ncbi:MAG: type II secretion system secretin GspD [Pseudomonadota bacterium]